MVPFNGATNSRAGLISCRPWSSSGWPERQGSYLSYASGGPAQADTLGVAAPTHKHHVQMLPDVI